MILKFSILTLLLLELVSSGVVDTERHESQVRQTDLLVINTIIFFHSYKEDMFQRVLTGKPLSDKPHNEDDGDYEYDHEAFLGDDQAEYFDNLTPEESQRRLGLICDKIDLDGDGGISQDELRRWIMKVQQQEIMEDTEAQWRDKVGEAYHLETITWEMYKDHVFGFIDEDDPEGGYNFK